MISETNLDDSSPKAQFLKKWFSEPYRLDHNSKGGGITFFITEGIPSKLLSIEKNAIGALYVQINLRKMNFAKFLATPFFTEPLRWLLLIIQIRTIFIPI